MDAKETLLPEVTPTGDMSRSATLIPIEEQPADAKHQESGQKLLDEKGSPVEASDKAPTSGDNKVKAFLFGSKRRIIISSCLAILVVLVVVLVPVGLLVIAPSVAQRSINDSVLKFTNIDVTNPTDSVFTLHTAGKIENTGPMSAHISFPNGATIFYKDQAILKVPMDPVDASPSNGAPFDSTVQAQILNLPAYSNFTKDLLYLESFVWRIRGDVTVQASGLTFNGLTMDKEVSLKGYNNLQNTTIENVTLSSTNPLAGIPFVLKTNIYNPSPISIQMGTVTFNITLAGQTIGQAVGRDQTLRSGSNSIVLTGGVGGLSTTTPAPFISALFNVFVSAQDAVLTTVGANVVPSDTTQSPVSWLQYAFIGFPLKATLPGANKVQIITGLHTSTFDMSFNPASPWTPTLSSPGVVADLTLPFVFPLMYNTVRMTIDMLAGSAVAATVNSGWVPAKTAWGATGLTGTLTTDLTNAPIAVGTQSLFSTLLAGIFSASGTVPLPVSVLSDVQAPFTTGNVTLTQVPYKTSLPMIGMAGLKSTPPAILALDIVGGSPQGLQMTLTVQLTNPSNVQISHNSDVTFNLVSGGQVVGTVTLPNLTLARGVNTLPATSVFAPASAPALIAGAKLLTAFLNGQNSTVNIAGSASSTTIAPLSQALQSVDIATTLPGLTTKLISAASLAVTADTATSGVALATFTAVNPFSTPLTVTQIKSQVLVGTAQIGSISQSFNLVVPAKSSATSPPLNLTIEVPLASLSNLTSLAAAAGGVVPTNIRASSLIFTVGSSSALVATYSQDNVPTTVGSG